MHDLQFGHQPRRTKRPSRALDRVNSDVKGSWPPPAYLGRYGIRNPILHDVLIALKRVNVERHIDVDRDDGSAFEVAKKWWAEK